MALRKAQRQNAKLRISVSAPSGCGKTMGSLLMSHGLTGDWSKIALIDTENGSGDLYSHLGEYNVLPLTAPYTVEKYTEAIHECEKAGMEVIIIDSLTHVWRGKGGLLEYQEKLGGTFKDWAKVTPIYQDFLDVILNSPAHIITTIRKKTKYEMSNENGKSKVTKLGLDDEIRDGYEYEMTVAFSLNENLYASPSKDRTSLFKLRQEEILSEETGKKLKEWSESGVDPVQFQKELDERLAKEKLEREAREKEERDGLYNSLLEEMQGIKFLDDLASIWNLKVNPNKIILGEAYLKDLIERKDAIKEQLSKVPSKENLPAAEEKKVAPKTSTPKPPKIDDVPDIIPPVSSDISQEKTGESTVQEEPEKKVEEKDPTVEAFQVYIEKIRATTNVDELDEAWLEVETALGSKKITLQQHGVLASHKGIMLKKFPNQ